jgi:DNA-directed RNA polymerase II subunit RPB2
MKFLGTISAKNKCHDLDNDGFCPPGTKLFDDHVLFGNTSEDLRDIAMGSNRRKEDLSRPVTQKYANWTVDQVMVSYHKEKDCRIVKIRLWQMRTPQVGDKFASRHSQKGTVGMTFGQEDMPFARGETLGGGGCVGAWFRGSARWSRLQSSVRTKSNMGGCAWKLKSSR